MYPAKPSNAMSMNRKEGGEALDITVKFKLIPDSEQTELLQAISMEYISTLKA